MLRACIVLACCSLAGCLEPDLVACGNGIACPPDTVCDRAHKTCVTPEQAAACADRPDRTPCLDDGACHQGVCVPIRCGNWLRDPLEMCDDGNTLSNDGCSADCQSTERCGNGVIDSARGEECDEGDLASHDGCDSQCSDEEQMFTPFVQESGVAREHAAYAFDDARGKLVMFGGLDPTATRTGDTFELDATTRTWSVRSPARAPTARYGASAAYDARHHGIVLFGGSDASGSVADTWTWDGAVWHLRAPLTAPPPRAFASIAYDSRRHRVLLFGGRGASGQLADLWAWDGATWLELHPSSSPPARERAMFAYDAVNDDIVLFGGIAGSTPLADTWVFDGDAWTQLAPAGTPSARFGCALTFDPVQGGLVLTGGTAAAATQLWTGSQWTALGTAGGPMGSRIYHIAFFDPSIRATVAGLGSINDVLQTDLARLDGEAWNTLVQGDGPEAVTEPALAYDARRGKTVMFGGLGAAPSQATWEHDGSVWTRIVPSDPPPARNGAGMAYDEGRAKTVMWGSSALDPDVYEWDGFAWTPIVAAGPAPRARPKLVYDPTSGTVVMFGGNSGATKFGDTWQWNGTAWTEVTTSPSPPPRTQHALAYDHAHGQIVLFGGSDTAGMRMGDTWTWTASGGWHEEHPLASPSPRVRHLLASDPIRGEVVLVGGAIGNVPVGDVWRWDGATWNRAFPDDSPPGVVDAAAAYDRARRHILLHGPAGTWRLQWRGVAPDEACRSVIDRDDDGLSGCDDADCAGYCTPLCPLGGACGTGPTCGDGMCSTLEGCRLCSSDCSFCAPRCGDGFCDGGEMCSGECP